MNPDVIKEWQDKLVALLDEARVVAASASFDSRMEMADKLHVFVMENPQSVPDQPETLAFDEMDRIARKAHDGLLLEAIESRVTAVMGQTTELAGLIRKVQAQTLANQQSAKSIRLEKAQKVVVSVTDTIRAINDLKAQIECENLTDEGIAAMMQQLGTTIDSLQGLRTTIESSG